MYEQSRNVNTFDGNVILLSLILKGDENEHDVLRIYWRTARAIFNDRLICIAFIH